ncbi:MAG: hypothetical protein WCM76_10655 [Bacteroidota bacterium]
MKNISKFVLVLLIAACAMPAFQSCKKGDNDPGISFKSRKSRLVGEWNVTKGKLTQTSGGSVATMTYDGSSYSVTSGGTTTTGTYTFEYSILKDGKYTSKETRTVAGATTSYSYEGFWYFLDANKNLQAKNKERVAFQCTKYTYTSGTTTTIQTYTGDNPDEYYLDELKGKEMIWKRSLSATGGSTTTIDYEYTLTLK